MKFCRQSIQRRHGTEKGSVAIILVSMILGFMMMALVLSNWVRRQQHGGINRRVAVGELLVAQSAVGEVRQRIWDEASLRTFNANNPQSFTYSVDGEQVTVTIEYVPYP